MADASTASGDGRDTASRPAYHPEYLIPLPAIYQWPPKPLAALRYLLVDLMFPWGYAMLAMAWACWRWFTPELATMATFSPDWIAAIWLRNAVALGLVAGGLHWWFYMRRGQGDTEKFDRRWQAEDDERFLFRDQVRDNMFWSLVSGVTIWTAWESVTWWMYANGRVPALHLADNPYWFVASVYLVFFWGTVHFYIVHRLLHVKGIYEVAHALHHRNANPGPWTGISMHPLEHLVYLSVFVLYWIVPVHPVIILLAGFFNGVSPAISHSGFDHLYVRGRRIASTGDLFHQLHHRYFHVNYGNTTTPLDQLAHSWHDNGESGRAILKTRMRRLR